MEKKSLMMIIVIIVFGMSSPAQVPGAFTDSRDGKKYKTVTIGTQIWMAENLAYRANSGYWACNNDQGNVSTYGYLYTWETAKIACPSGWHLPYNGEWLTLITYLGGDSIAGGKMKESATIHWDSPNSNANNLSGFTGLPGGTREFFFNKYLYFGGFCGYWSATESSTSFAFIYCLNWDNGTVFRVDGNFLDGWSVRCIKN